MNRTSWITAAAFGAAIALPLAAGAADDKPGAGGMDMSSMAPKPGPEMALMASRAGHWTATATMSMGGPGAPVMTMEGTEDIEVINNGLATTTQYHATKPFPFDGFGMGTWDGAKKKYVGMWHDSMSLSPSTWEGDASPDGKTFTMTMMGPDMTGKIVPMTMIETIVDKDHRGWKSWQGTDTSGPPAMTMDYVRVAAPAVIKTKTKTKSNQSND